MSKRFKIKSASRLRVGLEISAVAFIVVLALAAWFYRDEIFRTLNDPGQPFQTYTPTPAPNYAQADAWLALPDLAMDPELIAGDGDIFVVAPTLYTGGKDWVAPVQDEKLRAEFDRIITPNYVTPYRIGGRVFAPIYRQASLYSFLTNRDDARIAQKFAYADIARAFETFLSAHRPERPIILIGHGQGGLHVQRLIDDYFTGDEQASLRGALAAAYIIDHPSVQGALPSGITVCDSAEQIGCVVAFGAFMPSDDALAEAFVTRTLVFEDGGLEPVDSRPLSCVNPLLWTQQTDYAPARLHKGGVAGEGLGPDAIPAPAQRQVGAQCEDGVLLLDKPKQRSLRRPAKFGGRFRTLPSNIFYEDLRQNVVTRIQALIAAGTLPKRAPIMEFEAIEVIDSPVTLPDG